MQKGTTQGDPLAMAMYGLATIPLIRRMDGPWKQVWYADDSAATGTVVQLREWWDRLATEGPGFGYVANPAKTWLVIKDGHCEEASRIFAGSGVNITSDGRPYLGAAIGSQEFIEGYVRSKVQAWSADLSHLSEIALSQPHAAFSALTHGLLSKWTYLSRVIPNISHLLIPLDSVLRSDLLPALTGRPPPGDLECALFALPARLGGLGIRFPSRNADKELQSSLFVTSSLTDHILDQDKKYGQDIIDEQRPPSADRTRREASLKQTIFTASCPTHSRGLLPWPGRRELLLGSPFFPSRSMVSPCTRLLSMTLCYAVRLDPSQIALQMQLWQQFYSGARSLLC